MNPQTIEPRIVPIRFAAAFLVAILLAPLVAVTLPRGLAPLTIAASIIGVALFRMDFGRWPIPERSWMIILGGFLAYGVLSALWSIRPGQSVRQAAELGYTLIPALLLATAATRTPGLLNDRRAGWFLLAYALGFTLLMLDTLHGLPIYYLMRGNPGHPMEIEGSLINRNMVAMAALAWPAMQVLWLRRQWVAAILLPVATMVLVTGGQSQSAMVGLLAGLITLAVAVAAPVLARWALGVGVVVVFIGTIPAMEYLYSLNLIDRGGLPFSFVHRIEIWHFASNLALQQPLLGWGLDSSRSLAERVFVSRGGYEFPVLPLHPHNAILQIWLELGFVGVLFGIATGLTVLRQIGRLPRESQPVALAAFAGTLAMVSVAYGIWQAWWLGALILSMLTIHVLARSPRVG